MDNNIQLTFNFQDEATYRFAYVALKDTFVTSSKEDIKELTLTMSGSIESIQVELAKRMNLKKCILVDFDLGKPDDEFQNDLLEFLRACLSSARICLTQPEEYDALHRFRVDLRALRSLLYNARRLNIEGFEDLSLRLKRLSKSSNAARDNEVMAMLFEKFGSDHDSVPIYMSEKLRDEAFEVLRQQATELWLEVLVETVKPDDNADFHDLLESETRKRWKKLKHRCIDLDMKDDASMHRLRIDLKKLNTALSLLQTHRYDVSFRLDQVKTLQSELGQIRDLRRFYILPGLDAQTRYRAVSKLTTLEGQFKERFDPKSK